jgi:hypothetical protein
MSEDQPEFAVGELVVVESEYAMWSGLAEVLTCDFSIPYGYMVQMLNGSKVHGQEFPCTSLELCKLPSNIR